MVKKLVAFMRDKKNEDIFYEGFYHTILFAIVYVLYSTYKTSTIGNSNYIFLFFFVLTSYGLIKYFLSCKQKFAPITKKQYPLSIKILAGYLINTGIWLAVTSMMMFFYGKIEILNQQLLDKQITDHPKMLVPQLFDTVISAPLMEEILYRGLLLNAILFIGLKLGVSKKYLFVVFLVLSALIFGSIHASSNILTFIGFSLIGLNLGALYLISGNLIVPITVHFLNNLSASLNVSNDLKRISIFICLLLIICLIEYVCKEDRNIIKKWAFSLIKKDKP